MDSDPVAISVTYHKTSRLASTFLNDMLYMAIYVPEKEPAFSRALIDTPELRKYKENFGSRQLDLAIEARLGKEKIGLVWGRVFSAVRPSYGFISEDIPEISMAVKPDFRRRGVGSYLLAKIASDYQKKGVRAISLSVDHRNPARELYKRFGFEYFSKEGSSITMVKHLVQR